MDFYEPVVRKCDRSNVIRYRDLTRSKMFTLKIISRRFRYEITKN